MAFTTNIESREWRRKFCSSNGLPSEHPHASSTDDVLFQCLTRQCRKRLHIERSMCLGAVVWYVRTL